MSILKKKSLAAANMVYWFLLVYIVVALAFWYISLEQQSRQMTTYKLLELKADDPDYLRKVETITKEEELKTAQYIGEGITFLLIILLGASFVYRAVRKQIRVAQQQQNFMMAITHELKTPIAVAKLNLETLLKHKLDEERREKMLRMILLETNRLNALTNNILITSQLEGEGYRIVKEELDLSRLAGTSIQEFRERFPDRPWEIYIEEGLFISGDMLLLQILINNLLDNALKYSPGDSPIGFTLEKHGSGIVLRVSDQGAGIPDKEKRKIFDRFYRIGNETVRSAKGTGLGLYLCTKIVRDHNASIQVTNNTPAGSVFTIKFKP